MDKGSMQGGALKHHRAEIRVEGSPRPATVRNNRTTSQQESTMSASMLRHRKLCGFSWGRCGCLLDPSANRPCPVIHSSTTPPPHNTRAEHKIA